MFCHIPVPGVTTLGIGIYVLTTGLFCTYLIETYDKVNTWLLPNGDFEDQKRKEKNLNTVQK